MGLPKHQIKAGDGDPRHGTPGGYTNHRCRCDPCKAAGHEYERMRLRRNGRKSRSRKNHLHPSARCYHLHGCRCPGCEQLIARQQQEREDKARLAEVSKAERRAAARIAQDPLIRIGRVSGKHILTDEELLSLRVLVGLVTPEAAARVACNVPHNVIQWGWPGDCPDAPTQEDICSSALATAT